MSDNKIFAAGLGLQTFNAKGEVIATRYPKAFIRKDTNADVVDDFVNIFTEWFDYKGGNITIPFKDLNFDDLLHKFKDHEGTVKFLKMTRSAHTRVVVTLLETDEAPNDVNEAFLKLTLLSNRSIKPNQQNLDGIFGKLKNNFWTSEGPIDASEIEDRLLTADVEGKPIHVYSEDRFPQMLNYVVPTDIRIAVASRVRLGAHIAKDTVVMHEGFANFNSGTESEEIDDPENPGQKKTLSCMIEGRISHKVVIGAGTDLGGGSSTMGTLSGLNDIVVSIGRCTLIGANAGAGIPIGDNCIIEAGLYLKAGMKIDFIHEKKVVYTLKSEDFSNVPGLKFIRCSQTGRVEVLRNTKIVKLNDELQSNS